MSRRYTVQDLKSAVLACALAEHSRTVRDDDDGLEGDRERITTYYRAIGRAPLLPLTPDGKPYYRETAATKWCAVFAMFCHARLGNHLEPDRCVAAYLDLDVAYEMISTYRLASHEFEDPNKWDAAGVPVPAIIDATADPARALDALAEPGTLATIASRDYGNYRDRVGGHVVLSSKVEGDAVHTVEGNAHGTLGDGAHGEGVVLRSRPIAEFRRVYLFDERHFEQIGVDGVG